jgi:signal transduction histidine kinase
MTNKLSIRVRLTLFYGGMFFVAGAFVLFSSYLLVSGILTDRLGPSAPARVLADSGIPESRILINGVPPDVAVEDLRAGIAADAMAIRDETLNSLLAQSLMVLGLVGVAAVGSGWLMAGRVLRPLHRITATARRVADDRGLHERIGLEGPADELRELADTFDAMLERLGRAFDSQRHFVANASHELRTPLAINRTLIEVASTHPDAPEELRRLGETLLAVNARHERLIDGLLLLARSDAAITEPVAVDLDEITEHVETRSCAAARTADVLLSRRPGPAPTVGDPVLLERVVENLVDNGIRYNTRGGKVEIATGATPDHAWVTVLNTGPVVPEYAVPGLFEPFRRLRERTGAAGSGLGLSIVASVVRAHGGWVGAEPRRGGGLVVRVELPRVGVGDGGGQARLGGLRTERAGVAQW